MYKKLLVPIDGSSTSDRGFDEALALARDGDASLVLMHVIDPLPMFSGLEMVPAATWDQIQEGMRSHGQTILDNAHRAAVARRVAVQDRLVEAGAGRVADAIVEVARKEGCDLIVMGTHGRRGVSHIAMGSDAERVARQSPVPLLLVRAPSAAPD